MNEGMIKKIPPYAANEEGQTVGGGFRCFCGRVFPSKTRVKKHWKNQIK